MSRSKLSTLPIPSTNLSPWLHQNETTSFFKPRFVGFDFSDPGTGKTRSMLEVYRARKIRKRLLVVCPKTLMSSAWGNDIERFTPELTFSLATAENREAAFTLKTDVVIINIDGVKWLADKKNQKYLKEFDHLIIDEGTAFKHPTSKRSKAMVQLRKFFKHRYLMTGTPNANSVMELWNLALIVDDGARLGTSYFKLRAMVQTPTQVGPSANHLRWDDKPGIATVINELLADITIRHVFEDVMTNVPANHRDTKTFTLNKKTKAMYDRMEVSAILALKETVVTAVHAASLRTKLLQIACICYDTPVLTNRGWVPIQDVSAFDLVWDGDDWVTHHGSVLKGTTTVIKRHGVWMTPEHRVLTQTGWVDGKFSERFKRADVRLPYGDNAPRHDSERMRDVVMPLRLRQRSESTKPVSAQYQSSTPTQLRMPSRQRNTQNDAHTAVLQMGRHAQSLLQPVMQGLQKLGRAWNHGMQALAGIVQSLLFGYGRNVSARIIAWPDQQQSGIQPKELSLGNGNAARQQSSHQRVYRNAERSHDNQASCQSVRNKFNNVVREDTSVRLVDETRIEPVYDIINCGPRTRFVVMDEHGIPLIVHNSGAVYTGGEDSAYEVVDTQRYELITDLVEERKHSLVFFNWTHQRDQLCKAFEARDIRFAVIDGKTPQKHRDEIVAAYQHGEYQTLLLHPKTGAHGLTLTRGTTTIIASPFYEADLLKQAIHRIYRGGQTEVTNTILVCAKGTVEEKVYDRLYEKEARMVDLLDLLSNNN